MSYEKLSEQEENIGKAIVNACFKIHKKMGPGLLEKVYEICLAYELKKCGYSVERQLIVPICYDEIIFDEHLKLDILVESTVIIECKSVELVNPVWEAQVLSHMKLMGKRLGYVVNFNVPLMKDGIKRIIL